MVFFKPIIYADYFTILNLSRKHCSSLKNIFLICTIYSEDENKYSINAVLSKITDELILFEKGIEIRGETYYALIAQTAGDNLGE